MTDVAIIGAGMAGISCAYHLTKHGINKITIYEKSRGIGGRMANRRAKGYHFDHGAQYFGMTNKEFENAVKRLEWLKKDIISLWRGNIGEIDPETGMFTPTFTNREVFVGSPAMNSIPKSLLQKIDSSVKMVYQTKIGSIKRDKNSQGWVLIDETQKQVGIADLIVIAIPAPQAIDLINKSNISGLEKYVHSLKNVEITPRWVLLLGFNDRLALPFDAAFVQDNKIRWIARNNSKPKRPMREAWTVHASEEWSKTHVNKGSILIKDEMLKSFQTVTNLANLQPEYHSVHLWRYAIVRKKLSKSSIFDKHKYVGFCGDFFQGKGVVDAFLSGKYLAKKIVNQLEKDK